MVHEPLERPTLELMAATMAAEADRALTLLAQAAETLPAAAAVTARRLLERKPDILARFARLPSLEDAGMRIRIHGDFHLGQALEVDGDFYFIDFEGEPARPIAERRMKQSPMRDVAGMLRSFGYAARAGLRVFLRSQPDLRISLEPWSDAWEREAAGAFLRGYLRPLSDSVLLPGNASREPLLEAFLLEKGLYELSYELGSRPEWIDIPLAGLLQLVEPSGAPWRPAGAVSF